MMKSQKTQKMVLEECLTLALVNRPGRSSPWSLKTPKLQKLTIPRFGQAIIAVAILLAVRINAAAGTGKSSHTESINPSKDGDSSEPTGHFPLEQITGWWYPHTTADAVKAYNTIKCKEGKDPQPPPIEPGKNEFPFQMDFSDYSKLDEENTDDGLVDLEGMTIEPIVFRDPTKEFRKPTDEDPTISQAHRFPIYYMEEVNPGSTVDDEDIAIKYATMEIPGFSDRSGCHLTLLAEGDKRAQKYEVVGFRKSFVEWESLQRKFDLLKRPLFRLGGEIGRSFKRALRVNLQPLESGNASDEPKWILILEKRQWFKHKYPLEKIYKMLLERQARLHLDVQMAYAYVKDEKKRYLDFSVPDHETAIILGQTYFKIATRGDKVILNRVYNCSKFGGQPVCVTEFPQKGDRPAILHLSPQGTEQVNDDVPCWYDETSKPGKIIRILPATNKFLCTVLCPATDGRPECEDIVELDHLVPVLPQNDKVEPFDIQAYEALTKRMKDPALKKWQEDWMLQSHEWEKHLEQQKVLREQSAKRSETDALPIIEAFEIIKAFEDASGKRTTSDGATQQSTKQEHNVTGTSESS